MDIDEAIKVAEAAFEAPWNSSEATRFECKFRPPTVLAILRFVKRWDELHLHHRTVDDCKAAAAALHKARAAVDEALK